MVFAKRLQDLRKRDNISQPELAKSLNISDRTIGTWERGIALPNSETIVKLADYFHVTIDYLLCRNVSQPVEDNQDEMFLSLQRAYQSLPLLEQKKMIKMNQLMFEEAFKEDNEK